MILFYLLALKMMDIYVLVELQMILLLEQWFVCNCKILDGLAMLVFGKFKNNQFQRSLHILIKKEVLKEHIL
jgi:hypothetical protein